MRIHRRGESAPKSRTSAGREHAFLTMAEIGRRLGISRSAVQQHEDNALRKLFVRLRDDPEVQQAFRDLLKR